MGCHGLQEITFLAAGIVRQDLRWEPNQSINPESQCMMLRANCRLSQLGTFMPIFSGGSP